MKLTEKEIEGIIRQNELLKRELNRVLDINSSLHDELKKKGGE